MSDEDVWIDGHRYRIMDRLMISYPLTETAEQKKARGDAAAPYVAYTSCRIERADD